MYKVNFAWLGDASISILNIEKVTEKTVVTDRGTRYLKQCQGHEVFDSLKIAKNCALNYMKQRIERLESQLVDARVNLAKIETMEDYTPTPKNARTVIADQTPTR
jgi:hypothetical protein